MLDGVEWAAGEIILFMLAATLVGFAIAYIFIRWFQRGDIEAAYEAELTAQEELARKAEHRLTESNKTLDKLQGELKKESERIGELEAQLEAAQESLASVEETGPDGAELVKLRADLAESAAARKELTARVEELDVELARRESKVTQIEEQLTPAPAGGDSAGPTKAEALDKMAEIADRTAGGASPADDDLKQVHGIGPKLERTLKDLGITSFRQIAGFRDDDIVYVTAALGAFKGRIERDDWMSSAAAAHAREYGEPV
ncbi:MAG: hypothetical protein QNJ81_00965 [Acidimicrobiia bacterium]|nr:hypothetical protein [Acidimicrobiia bacterium]